VAHNSAPQKHIRVFANINTRKSRRVLPAAAPSSLHRQTILRRSSVHAAPAFTVSNISRENIADPFFLEAFAGL
jgi:hypothetical protein